MHRIKANDVVIASINGQDEIVELITVHNRFTAKARISHGKNEGKIVPLFQWDVKGVLF